MRTPRALLAVLLAVLTGALTAVGVVVAAPSSAGGPTSVLLVNPATGRVAALYTTDARYQRLADLVGAFDGAPAQSPRPTVSGEAGYTVDTAGINVTWLVHDVQVWRVDRILVDAAGHVTLATQADSGEGLSWDVPPVLHEPSNARDLLAVLDGLGLRAAGTSPAAPATADATSAGTGQAASAPAASAPTTSTPAASTPGTTALPWAAAGAVLGAAAALATARLVAAGRGRRRAHEADDDDREPASPSAEVISSGR